MDRLTDTLAYSQTYRQTDTITPANEYCQKRQEYIRALVSLNLAVLDRCTSKAVIKLNCEGVEQGNTMNFSSCHSALSLAYSLTRSHTHARVLSTVLVSLVSHLCITHSHPHLVLFSVPLSSPFSLVGR